MITDLNRMIGKLREYEQNAKYPNAPLHFKKVYEKLESLTNDIEYIINENKHNRNRVKKINN